MAKNKSTNIDIDGLVAACLANPTQMFIVGHTYTILGVPPAWVRGRVIAENLVMVILAPGTQRLGDAPAGEIDYETVGSDPRFTLPVMVAKTAIVQVIYHGEI